MLIANIHSFQPQAKLLLFWQKSKMSFISVALPLDRWPNTGIKIGCIYWHWLLVAIRAMKELLTPTLNIFLAPFKVLCCSEKCLSCFAAREQTANAWSRILPAAVQQPTFSVRSHCIQLRQLQSIERFVINTKSMNVHFSIKRVGFLWL